MGNSLTNSDGSFNGYGDVAVGATIGGSLLTAYGAYSSASAQKTGLNYNAQIAAANAALASYQSAQTHVIANQQQAAQDLKTAATFGSQRASMAANGIDLSQGSANEVLASTKYEGAVDAMTIQDNATRQSTIFNTESANNTQESQMDTSMANSINPDMAAGASLLTGAATLAGIMSKF